MNLVKDIVFAEKIDFVCLQETKLEVINSSICDSLWPKGDYFWVHSGSIGNA